MYILEHPNDQAQPYRQAIVALGNFDGFHKGHQVVLGEAGRMARKANLPLGVVLTEPHPVTFFNPETAPFRLTGKEARLDLLAGFGCDWCHILPFTQKLAAMEAEKFITEILKDRLDISHVVVGFDYRFGKGREGDIILLKKWGKQLGFGVTVINLVPADLPIQEYRSARAMVDTQNGRSNTVSMRVKEDTKALSSTAIRQEIQQGHVRRAAALLGHWWVIAGSVVKGDQRGRTIGFPTANIPLGASIRPKFGVYAVRVRGAGDPIKNDIVEGIANIGQRPTFDKKDTLLEVHLFDFDRDIYGRSLLVEFVQFIRPEKKFDGIDALLQQIKVDCKIAKKILGNTDNKRSKFKRPTLDDYLNTSSGPHP